MSVTPEELAAYADGELDVAKAAAVEAEVARSAGLQAELAAHRALKARLAAHFAPIAEQPVPEYLSRLLAGGPPAEETSGRVIDLAAARRQRTGIAAPRLQRWLGPALAASLVLALVGIGLRPSGDYARGNLAQALDTQLAGSQAGTEPVRILLSFRDRNGLFCRGYAEDGASGIACRTDGGWKVAHRFGAAATGGTGEYRQAGSPAEQVFAAAQEMASGAALDEPEERAARAAHWTQR